MRRSGRQRDKQMPIKVMLSPSGTDPAQAAACRHVCRPYYKDRPGFVGTPHGHRSDVGISPGDLANERDRVEGRLRDAVGAGQTGVRTGGCPRYIRYRDGSTVFEVRDNASGSGRYRSCPLRVGRHVRGLP